MFRHVPIPGSHTGPTMDLPSWIEKRLLPAKFSGDEELLYGVERKSSGILFKDFQPAYGRPGAYLATPASIVVLSEAFGKALQNGEVIVPIGDIDYSDTHVRHVLQQCARQWCGGGRGNVNLSDTNVLIMYYSAIQSLVMEFVQSKTLEDLDHWAVPLLALVRGLAKLHDGIPQAKKVTEALIIVPCPDDMLQKALAHVFARQAPTFEDQVEMLEHIVRRTFRAEEECKVHSPGPLAVFLATPLLSSVLTTSDDILRDADTFVKEFQKVMQAYADAVSPTNGSQIRMMQALTQVAFVKPLTQAQITGFLAILKAKPMAPVPWASLRVLPPQQALVPSVHTDSFDVKGKSMAAWPAVIKPKSPTRFTAVGRKGTEWTGLQLLSSGVYTIHMTLLGTAESAVGDSRGEDGKANLRLTLGNDILTECAHSYSLAGMQQYQPATGELRYLWHIRQAEPMNVEKPIAVFVKKDEVVLVQDRRTFAKFPTASKPVLLAFKNALLDIQYEELTQSPKTPSVYAKLLTEEEAYKD